MTIINGGAHMLSVMLKLTVLSGCSSLASAAANISLKYGSFGTGIWGLFFSNMNFSMALYWTTLDRKCSTDFISYHFQSFLY
jgi:hypothetical protein